jgi:hypothetical protein
MTTSAAAASAPPAAATPAPARSTASTTEVGTKVWHSDHRYIFSINNTIPVASATEKTFTAYLVQVLDVDTGEEASILRRYRQFEYLHDKISAMYPKKMVPKVHREEALWSRQSEPGLHSEAMREAAKVPQSGLGAAQCV